MTDNRIHRKALVDLAKRAQYFYYVKFRLGTCLPSKCSLADVQKLANVGEYFHEAIFASIIMTRTIRTDRQSVHW